ncbi:MAG: glycosyltransferase [Gammaproteobacteria bacterium]|nr:MAG: glycosyltransferase [Gammaproteobacteria bacterium]
MGKPNVALIIPTLNAEQDICVLLDGVMKQTWQPQHILVIDSSSTDKTATLLSRYPVTVHTIPREKFDHGGTRQLALELVDADIYIYMTQDVMLAHPTTFENLIRGLLSDKKIGCAYGRQLPKHDANPLSIHGRLFNYRETSELRYYADKAQYGIKTFFNSNNLAAYRKSALQAIGGFPAKLITAEDAYVAAKMLQQGYGIYYAADAMIYHSHNLSLAQEFHRYFSIGVFHRRENWLINEFSAANAEGMRFVRSEIQFLIKQKKIQWIPLAWLSTLVKYVGYQVGRHEHWVPLKIKKNWGVNKTFWIPS